MTKQTVDEIHEFLEEAKKDPQFLAELMHEAQIDGSVCESSMNDMESDDSHVIDHLESDDCDTFEVDSSDAEPEENIVDWSTINWLRVEQDVRETFAKGSVDTTQAICAYIWGLPKLFLRIAKQDYVESKQDEILALNACRKRFKGKRRGQ